MIPIFSKFGGSLLPSAFVSPKGCRVFIRICHQAPRYSNPHPSSAALGEHADLAPWAPGDSARHADGGGADGFCGAGVVAARRGAVSVLS